MSKKNTLLEMLVKLMELRLILTNLFQGMRLWEEKEVILTEEIYLEITRAVAALPHDHKDAKFLAMEWFNVIECPVEKRYGRFCDFQSFVIGSSKEVNKQLKSQGNHSNQQIIGSFFE